MSTSRLIVRVAKVLKMRMRLTLWLLTEPKYRISTHCSNLLNNTWVSKTVWMTLVTRVSDTTILGVSKCRTYCRGLVTMLMHSWSTEMMARWHHSGCPMGLFRIWRVKCGHLIPLPSWLPCLWTFYSMEAQQLSFSSQRTKDSVPSHSSIGSVDTWLS